MANERYWLLGRDLTSINLYGGTQNATTGEVTWSVTAINLVKRVDYIRLADDRTLENIIPVNASQAHYEELIADAGLVVGEIMRKSGVLLAVAVQNFRLFKVVFTRGTGTYTFYGRVRNFSDGVTAFGKNAVELTLAQVDVSEGTAPLAYVEA